MRKPPIPREFICAFKAGNRSVSREFIDEDFSYELLNRILDSNWKDKEAIESLKYIHKFNQEFHRDLIRKNDDTSLHCTNDLRKDCHNRGNARKRDISSREHRFMKSVETCEKTDPKAVANKFQEEIMIYKLDKKYDELRKISKKKK